MGLASNNDFRWVLHRLKFLNAEEQVICLPQTEGSPGTAIALSHIASTPPSRVFGDNDDHWSGDKRAEAGEWVGYNFRQPTYVEAFMIKHFQQYNTSEVVVEASADGESWIHQWTAKVGMSGTYHRPAQAPALPTIAPPPIPEPTIPEPPVVAAAPPALAVFGGEVQYGEELFIQNQYNPRQVVQRC